MVHRQDANLLYVVIRGQTLVFDWHKNEFRFEYSSFSKLVPDRRQVPLPDEATLSVRLVVDKIPIEVFINGGVISASFCFLPNGYEHPFEIHSYPTEQVIEDCELHDPASIWS
jgi:sucrose-6-phosphate hydrolase SacC (GH32 family)|tara:strand:- start:1576 stop:1914 length:339 start_codon:yes stop_codon:yes gene_type:complete